jgi:hypothetical protein
VLLRWPSMDQAVNRWPLNAETQVISSPVLVRFVVYEMAVTQDFFRVIPVFLASNIPPMLHIHSHITDAIWAQ